MNTSICKLASVCGTKWNPLALVVILVTTTVRYKLTCVKEHVGRVFVSRGSAASLPLDRSYSLLLVLVISNSKPFIIEVG